MPGAFPSTPPSLLSQLREQDNALSGISWKQFLSLYLEPIRIIAANLYRRHTNGHPPPEVFVEEIVAKVVADFFSQNVHRYDASKGRLRTFLRLLTNIQVIEFLRREQPAAQANVTPEFLADQLSAEDPEEAAAYHRALLATLIEDLREQIPYRQFEIFEMVKLHGVTPAQAADHFGVRRNVIDNTIYKVMTKLRTLAARTEYQEEFLP